MMNGQEKGLEEFISAVNSILPKEVIIECGRRITALQGIEIEKDPRTNRYLIALYQVLFDKNKGPTKTGKMQFNQIQKKWVDNIIKGHEEEISSSSLLENLINYNKIVNGSDILVEPDGQGAKITMKNGCMYSAFCNYTENRKCVRGTAIKYVASYLHPEPCQILLERPVGTHTCVIRVKPDIESTEIMAEYQKKGMPITLL